MKKNMGILLVDKLEGISSHGVVNRVRRLTGVKRVGHAGTLDPLATGLLVILVGREFTKQQSLFLKQDKTYVCTAQLGVTTDTYDNDGTIVQTIAWEALNKITETELKSVVSLFQGKITQVVPAFSAVKVAGQKLYQKARRGEINHQDLPARDVTIHQISLDDFSKKEKQQQLFFTLTVDCSSGTYIRSLIHDIGQKLKVGATVTSLRRTKIGSLSITQAHTLTELQSVSQQTSSLPFLVEIPDLSTV